MPRVLDALLECLVEIPEVRLGLRDRAGVIGTITAVIYYRLYIAGDEGGRDVGACAAATAAAAARAGAYSVPPP